MPKLRALDDRQLKAVEILAEGKGVRVAAKAVGVSRTAIYQWLAKPMFFEAVTRVQAGVLRNTYNRLIFANDRAVNTLRSGMSAKPEVVGEDRYGNPIYTDTRFYATRIKAADRVLDLTLRFGEQVAIHDRMAAYEERLAELEQGGTNEDDA